MSLPIARPLSHVKRAGVHAACGLTAALLSSATMLAQRGPVSPVSPVPTNDLPNPYQSIEHAFALPDGRMWGSTSAVEIGKDGRSIWVAERCGVNSCVTDPTTGKMSPLDPILHYDASGKLIKSFGAGLLVGPHGIFVDRDGNVWVTDYQDNAPRAPRGAGNAAGAGAGEARRGGAPAGPLPGATVGHLVYKFSPDGKVLMTLGKPGGGIEPDFFFQPNDVLVTRSGEIIVSCGHGQGSKSEILKFSKDGRLIKRWGQTGTGPGEFDQPHALAMDSKGRLFIGDRNNNRIQIFDQDGKFLEEWKQFSRPSGIYIDRKDTIYVADSESESVSRNHDGWKRGIRIGSARDGSVKYFIPDPVEKAPSTSAAEGVAADSQGNVYGAEVGPRRLMKYVMKK
jgi:sugar lactone lactonase YvrE